MNADRRSDDSERSIMAGEPQRPDLAQELIRRAAEVSERWAYLTRGQLSVQDLNRGRLTDQANAGVMQRIFAGHGWPGWSLVGEDGATAAWQIALHADHSPFQRLAARLMHQAVQANDASPRQWAHLHDRCLVHSGAGQEYGTQYRPGPAGPERLAVHDPQSLDERRARVGLPPAAVSLEILRRRRAQTPRLGPVIEIPADEPSAELMSAA
ncbi:hypothetical protein OG413_20410 [Streptomyces sp. NBC_01433]|uniref:DUF6624 domain-containing protein n=1 Tax=Streptomyces sp. NBC_01433 TaxID=2903864 RepID=UPI00225206AC|nr:DUF6624 domain-containing protein [Streptomyces sp. NBC_01433]MCX4677637.1 hypothetical protein [Streptomyces sp. NBC_01433]